MTTIEIRRKCPGFGYKRGVWPETVHHILSVGTAEVRVIVPKGETLGVVGTVSLMVASLVTLITGGAR